LKDFKIVPIVMGESSFENCKTLGEVLIKTIKHSKKNVLVIASTDFSHYHSYEEANSIDRLTLSYLEKFDAELLFEKVSKGECELCGVGPVIAALIYAKGIGVNGIKVLKYANSGDVTGDRWRVVGYGAAAVTRSA
ncbi:MAG: AmmeMemoRadiSam system protein B, partial [Chloroflexi bacterium]|nr:AmmeMemoRadiSam system protein B [Chloroflexota bacterium]